MDDIKGSPEPPLTLHSLNLESLGSPGGSRFWELEDRLGLLSACVWGLVKRQRPVKEQAWLSGRLLPSL